MLLNAFRGLFSNSQNRKARRSCPPQILQLESRIVPATITVTTTADTVDSDPNVTSLREAITTANGTSANDIIDFSVTGTITLDSVLQSLPTIASTTSAGTLTITGPGASSLIISGLGNSSGTSNPNRDFNIFNIANPGVFPSGGNLTISGVTVSGANASSFNGGAFNNRGTLAISNSTISGNTSGGSGGGIYNGAGYSLTVSNSTLSSNTAADGGGIFTNLSSSSTVSNSTLSGNTTTGRGGSIHNQGGTLTLINSTISGNTAALNGGGGIFNSTAQGGGPQGPPGGPQGPPAASPAALLISPTPSSPIALSVVIMPAAAL